MATRKKKIRKEITCLRNSLDQYLQFLSEEEKENMYEDLPRKWEKHGDMILLSQDCFLKDWSSFLDAKTLWESVAVAFKVKTIAKKGTISRDGKRTPQVTLLLGENDWVCHIDNKIKYFYDVTKCMFSVGNITEKMRMAKLQCEDEMIVDMFAGIGYFTLPLLVHAGGKHVHACEWNEDAVKALKYNLIQNKVESRCTVYLGDNRQVCPVNVADRVIMGLIPSSTMSILPACKALKYGHGGILHIHGNVESKIKDTSSQHPEYKTNISSNKHEIPKEWIIWAEEIARKVKITSQELYKDCVSARYDITTAILHIEKVKSYAPHIDHLVLDMKVNVAIMM